MNPTTQYEAAPDDKDRKSLKKRSIDSGPSEIFVLASILLRVGSPCWGLRIQPPVE